MERGLDVTVVCAGTERGLVFSLEDTVAAGAIVEAAQQFDSTLHLADSAWAALHLWRWYKGDAMRAFKQSRHGRALLEQGFENDLRYASRVDASQTVPWLHVENGMRVLRTRTPRNAGQSALAPAGAPAS